MDNQEQIACIFCGKATLKDRLDLDVVANNYSVDWAVLQVREALAGPGRGKRGSNKKTGRRTGWPIIEKECKSIVELSNDPHYSDLVEAIKNRLVMIAKAYIKAGIIKSSDLRTKAPAKTS
jgi:hypothetical protein